MAGEAWDPAQYDRFAAERRQPFLDLLALVRPRPDMRIVDLGCGTGEPTRTLHEHLRATATLGVDNSPAMLARSHAFDLPGLAFRQGDIADFVAEHAYDLVFSNAALHWLPDHPALLARLTAALADSGQLAVQVPANFDHPSHTVAADVATEEPFRSALGGAPHRSGVLAPEAYASLLAGLGYREQHVRLQVYGHWLPDRDAVVEWTRGTLLTDYRSRLPPTLYEPFVARYRACLLPRLSSARPFFFPFKRILLWAQK